MDRLEENGTVTHRAVLDPEQVGRLASAFADIPSHAAGQRWFDKALAVLLAQDAMAPVRSLIHEIVEQPVALRAVAFRKCADANWLVPPHQDRSVPIPTAEPPDGFSRPTKKGTHWQAEAPVALLNNMRNFRIFIDPADETDGPLQVLSGSHREGRLTQPQIAAFSERREWSALTGAAGDVAVLSPLLVHRSNKASDPAGRRVLQIEVLPRNAAAESGLNGARVPA